MGISAGRPGGGLAGGHQEHDDAGSLTASGAAQRGRQFSIMGDEAGMGEAVTDLSAMTAGSAVMNMGALLVAISRPKRRMARARLPQASPRWP